MSPPLELQYTIVDAFTSRIFAGNAAAVIVLPPEAATLTLQLIAREFNLSETAFVTPTNDESVYGLRWFTPTTEVRLCGHATLASAHVLQKERVTFKSQWSQLVASKHPGTGKLELAFPAGVPDAISGIERDRIVGIIRKAVGRDTLNVEFVGGAPGDAFAAQLLVHIDDSLDLSAANVDTGILVRTFRAQPQDLFDADYFGQTALFPFKAIIVTNRPPQELQAAGKHFVSRVFGPLFGIPEDPVTGSAHCMLAPYWAKALGKSVLSARQVSARTGDLEVEWVETEGIVKLRGDAMTAATGVIYVPRE
ncbi:Diaminopimelate epimerase-like protein [Auricularia subglabra TFB-10046 SS5]|nr:Diaminopimelate epimerase-like protein [Auricularia subglabra TFB-10046 SS5]